MIAQAKADALAKMALGSTVWFDGELIPAGDLAVHAFTHALHYGSGVFEGIRAYETPRGPGIFRLRDHMARFERSARVYSLEVREDVDAMCRHVVDTMRANKMQSAYIRPLAYFGVGTLALAAKFNCPTHVFIGVRAMDGYFGERNKGIRIALSPWRKFSSAALPATVKCSGHYANSVLAMQDAITRGFAEAIMLNDRGEIAEGTGENVFFVKDGHLYTNDTSADALDGITRDSVLTLARDRGIPTTVRPMTLDDLLGADEVFLTGTAAEVTAAECIDDRVFNAVHPVTDTLAAAYLKAVSGQDELHADWITYVN